MFLKIFLITKTDLAGLLFTDEGPHVFGRLPSASTTPGLPAAPMDSLLQARGAPRRHFTAAHRSSRYPMPWKRLLENQSPLAD